LSIVRDNQSRYSGDDRPAADCTVLGALNTHAAYTPERCVNNLWKRASFHHHTGCIKALMPSILGKSPIATGLSVDFLIHADATRVHNVDTRDPNVLSVNFGGVDELFADRYFNYDGVVNRIDFNFLHEAQKRHKFPSSTGAR